MYKLLYLVSAVIVWESFQRWHTAGIFRLTAIEKINRIYPLYLVTCTLEYYYLFG